MSLPSLADAESRLRTGVAYTNFRICPGSNQEGLPFLVTGVACKLCGASWSKTDTTARLVPLHGEWS